MIRIFTSFLLLISLLGLSIIAEAAKLDILATNQTTNMLADLKAFAPPGEQTKSVPETSSNTVVSPDKAVPAAKVKDVIFESESYKFRETSTLESMTFALICIGFIGLIAARRFKRAFV